MGKSGSVSRVLYSKERQSFIWKKHHCSPQATYPETRASHTMSLANQWRCFPIWSCTGWGFHCHFCYQKRGALLPHHFNLTCSSEDAIGGIFSAALSIGSRRPAVSWHPALRCPDFPPKPKTSAIVQPTFAWRTVPEFTLKVH